MTKKWETNARKWLWNRMYSSKIWCYIVDPIDFPFGDSVLEGAKCLFSHTKKRYTSPIQNHRIVLLPIFCMWIWGFLLNKTQRWWEGRERKMDFYLGTVGYFLLQVLWSAAFGPAGAHDLTQWRELETCMLARNLYNSCTTSYNSRTSLIFLQLGYT